MNDHELDTLVAGASPVSDADLEQWLRGAPLEQLCEAIIADAVTADTGSSVDPATVTDEPRPGRVLVLGGRERTARRRWPRVAVLTATAAAVLGIGTAVIVGHADDDGSRAWAAPLVEFAGRSPLMLMNDDAWHVTRADESSDAEGEMTFSGGTGSTSTAELSWRSGPLAGWVDDRKHDGIDHGTHAVVNGTAEVIQYAGSTDFTALWLADDRVLEYRAQTPSLQEFTALLDTLVVVDTDTWLSAMPESVISNAEQGAVIDEMLVGIPLPAGFDSTALASSATVKDRYQLGARVVGAVSCAWIEQWLGATSNADPASAQEAVAAMQTSAEWPILVEMNASGDYGHVLEEYVDAMVSGADRLGPKGATIADTYGDALGC
jgi:hypothetical protein